MRDNRGAINAVVLSMAHCWRGTHLSPPSLFSSLLLQEMIQEADRDNDGVINADEFYRVMKKRSANPLDDLDSDDDI